MSTVENNMNYLRLPLNIYLIFSETQNDLLCLYTVDIMLKRIEDYYIGNINIILIITPIV